jgi:hypothetical protein
LINTTSEEILGDLRRLSATGVSAMVSTCDHEHVPELSRGWGLVVSDAGEIVQVCVYAGVGARTLSNLAEHPQMAVTMTRLSSYRSLQIKGWVVRTLAASEEDLRRVSIHQRAFVDEAAAVGIPREAAAVFCHAESEYCADLMTITMHIESVFDQTPGPGAGARR